MSRSAAGLLLALGVGLSACADPASAPPRTAPPDAAPASGTSPEPAPDADRDRDRDGDGDGDGDAEPTVVDAALVPSLDDLRAAIELDRVRARNALIKEAMRGRGRMVAQAIRSREWSGEAALEANNVLLELGPDGLRAFAEDLERGAGTPDRMWLWVDRYGAEAIPLIRARVKHVGTLDDASVLEAISGLEGKGGEFAPGLLELVRRDPDAAKAVSYALPGLGEAGAPLARHLLRDRRLEIRLRTLSVLRQVEPSIDGVYPDLVARIAESSDPKEIQDAARVLCRMGRTELLLAVVREKMDAGALNAHLLVTLHYDPEGSAAFVRQHGESWLRDPDGTLRATALRLLTRHEVDLDDAKRVELILASLNDSDLHVVAEAVGCARYAVGDRSQTVPAVGALVRRLDEDVNAEHDPDDLSRVLLAAATFLVGWDMGDIDDAGDISLVVDHPELWLPELDVIRAAHGDRHDVGWVAFCGTCSESATLELERLLRLLQRSERELSRDACESLWLAVTVRPKDALLVLARRGGLSPDDLDRWLEVVRAHGPIALRFVEHIVRTDDAAERTLELVLPLVVPDRKDVANEAIRALTFLGPRATSAQETLLAQVVERPDVARALGAMGPTAIHATMRRVEEEPADVRETIQTRLLQGVRQAAAVASEGHTRASCRTWLLDRYGPLEPSTGLPRDIPRKRDDLLRWAIYEATAGE